MTASDPDPAEALRRYWIENNCSPCPGASALQIAEFEQQHAVLLPNEIRAYFRLTNGLNGTDPDLFSFWQLERVCTVPERYSPSLAIESSEEYIVFADVYVSSIEYAVRCSSESIVVAIALPSVLRVANSFAEFVQSYVADAQALASS